LRQGHANRRTLHRRTVIPGETRFLMTDYTNPRYRLAPRTSSQTSAPSVQNGFNRFASPSPNMPEPKSI
jgi:hypothetical protein